MSSSTDDSHEANRQTVALQVDDDYQPILTSPKADDLAGKVLGQWQLVRELGSGGMGTVWLAKRADGAFRMNAAIKLIRKEMAGPDFVERFRRERQILADLAHGNIARLLDGGATDDGIPYLVMEHIDGQPLGRFYREQGPSPEQVIEIFVKICSALSAAHSQNIIHRDLKPSNIMMTSTGEPKLLDFGIARIRTSTDEKFTPTQQLTLTPSYASPEQWRGEGTTPATDLFALGIMLLEFLADWHPSKPGLMGVEPPPEVAAKLDGELMAILSRAVQQEPDERYATADAFADALRDYLGNSAQATRPIPRVFISCRGDVAEDVELALAFYEALAAAGAAPFLAPKNISENENWVRAVGQALSGCDVFVLLLSRQAAVSEMVAVELELAWQLRESNEGKPHILPVRVRLPRGSASSSAIRDRLDELEEIEWQGSGDTENIVANLLANIGGPQRAPAPPAVERTTARAKPQPARNATRSPALDQTLPSASLSAELPGDVVTQSSPYYVARSRVEDQCLHEVVKPGALIRIKGPRQMGKTSLMRRLLDHAGQTGSRTVMVNLQLTDKSILTELDRFLRWLCAVVSRRLKIPTKDLDEYWDDLFGAKDNCTAYFEERLLPEGAPLVLAIDHVDRIFEAPATAEEFLALLRAWHEMGKSQEPWPNLRMVLVHATESYLPMNINRSPFNVGLPVALTEWDADTVRELTERHGVSLSPADIDELMSSINGHPHLVRLTLHELANGTSLADILSNAATDQGLYADHLKYLLWQLQSQPELSDAAMRVMTSDQPVRLSTELAFKLVSLGLVHLQGNEVQPARDLYRRYLRERLPVILQ